MSYILGIDEVGRGAWAGPLVLGAVVLGKKKIGGLNDSKLLTKQSREGLSAVIQENAFFYSLGWVNATEIDGLGLTAATTLGIRRALAGFDYSGFEMIIDGSVNYFKEYVGARCLIKADQSIPAVSAAGVIAKVARDEYMRKLAKKLPGFGFDKHVGYGTKQHIASINKLGVCIEHRLSYKPLSVFA